MDGEFWRGHRADELKMPHYHPAKMQLHDGIHSHLLCHHLWFPQTDLKSSIWPFVSLEHWAGFSDGNREASNGLTIPVSRNNVPLFFLFFFNQGPAQSYNSLGLFTSFTGARTESEYNMHSHSFLSITTPTLTLSLTTSTSSLPPHLDYHNSPLLISFSLDSL